MENNSFYFWLSVIANCCQLESYEMLKKDADNNAVMSYLQHQDNDYLKEIIEQNKQIIELLKKGDNNED
jgi:GTPase SAR1 family protein